ncbi:MAG: hypothetical protein CML02_07435 [Pseudooceanicola sp.]|nr:hypothetical protein [Pseudooceanicola sp.]|tara:strand:- start:1035 stop:1250 length:216 start_codon:yes stop_codon:yes gene_type:complete
MKLRIGPLASDIIICIYAGISLYFRFKLENATPISIANSIVIGLCFVVLLWVLIKLKILNPGWFGLFKNKN